MLLSSLLLSATVAWPALAMPAFSKPARNSLAPRRDDCIVREIEEIYGYHIKYIND
jgi:hypothetical protein